MAGREARPETREPDVGYVDSDGETPTTERELAEDAEWKKQQKNTFTRWTNEHLKKANCRVDNLETDLSDGLKLAALIEVLANYKFRQLNKKPIFRTQKLENVTKVLNFLQEHEGLKLISIDSSHIVDSNPKLILGLIWTLIMHYSISVATWEGEKSVSQDEEGRGLGPKQRLLVWVQQKIPESQVKNFTSDWNSGIAIGALVDACAPGLCPDWSIWDRRQPLRNATEAMTLADEWLSVPQLVHPEEMISSNVDEKAMMTYISQFPGAKLKAGAPLRPKISPEKVRTSGPGLRRNGNTLGEECQFSVDASDAGPGQLEVIILNPKGIKETCQVNENANKTQLYTCIYDTHMEGEHRVIIKFSGIEIPNSPFRVNIEGPASDPSKITVDGPGVEQNGENRVGRRTYFNIHAQDAGQGKPECVICDPSGRKDAVKSKITCPNSDADYLVEYTPKDAGVHQVFVSFAGKPIARSPFAVEVGPRESGKAAAVAALTAVVQAAQNPVNSSAPSAVGRLTNGTAKNGSSDEHTNGHLDDEQELSSLRNEMNGKSESPALNPILVASGGPQNTRFKKTFTAVIDGANTLGLILNEGATETIPAFGIACSPELAYTSGRGVQPRGIRVQDEVFFLVHTERTGDDNMPLEVKMIRSDGEVEKVKTTKLYDNVWKCSYVPQRPGKYSISVRYGNKDIQKSPFDIVVGPLKKSDVVAFGPGLHAGVVNQPNVFTVSCKEESSKISFSIEGPSEARMECFNNGDVSARVTYWVSQPGEYAVHITYDDEDIPNSPYMPQIYPDNGETHPNAIRIHGPGIEKSKTSLHVGKPVEFYIEGLPEAIPPSLYRSLSEANLESVLRANCWDAAGNPVPMKARLRPDGSVVFIYTPTSPGTHTITATVGNMSLKGMPYRVYVAPDIEPEKVKMWGPGLENAVRNQITHFFIDPREALGSANDEVLASNPISLRITDGQGNTITPNVIDQTDGTYRVEYTPTIGYGDIRVDAQLGSVPISKIPIRVPVKAEFEARRIRIQGLETRVYRSSYVKFVVDASAIDQTSEGTVEAILTDPDKKRMSCQVQSNNDGTYSCSYTPMDEGAHELEVTYEGVPVTGSPFKVQVTSGCDPKRVKAYGPGLEDGSHLEPGKKAEFTVDLTGAGQGGLGLAVEGPSEAPIECQDNRDGTCTVSYVPTEPGPYSVFVRFNDVNVPNSPFSVHVKAKVDPSKVKCSGPGLESGVLRAQWPAYFTVDTKKAGDATLKVMYRPKPGAEMCPATIQPVGSPVNWDSSQPQYYHKVTYTPEEEGPCDIEVTYDGKHVPGSPFRVEVRKSCEPERVRVLGAGVEGPVIASLPTTFTVDAREAGMGDLTLGLTDPRGQSVPVRLVPVSVDNESVPDAVNSLASGDVSDSGLLSCTYQPYLVGPHNIHVMFAGVEVENSPFTVDSLPTGRADLCQIISRIDNAIAVGEECVIPVNTAQAGKGCLTCQVIQQPSDETGASAALLPVDTEDNKDGTTTVFYTPTQLGRLDVELRYGGQLIPDGEFSQKVVTRDELDALKKLPAYRPVEFRLPAPKSDLEVECTVVRPSGEQQLVPHTVTDNNTITVSYEPVEQGMHELHVNAYAPVKPGESRTNAMIMPLQGSPYRFFVDTIGSGRVTAYGPGLSYGVTNHPAEFTVVTKDSGGGGLSLSVEGPSKAEIRCVENGDGTCNVSYLPLAPGKYTISIKFMGQHIAGSPFESKITGELSKRAQLSMGAPNDITLGTIGDDISTLTASVRSASGREEPCVLKRLPNNRLGISFTPKEVGEHLISVYRAGQHIENSPFRIQISEKEIGDPGRVRVNGPGLISGMANQPNQFTVDTREAGYAGLSLTVEGPSKAEIDCHDNRDGTCTVTYTPTEPGSYVINVKYADTHVPNSPFYVEVGGEYSGRVTEQITRHQEASQVTKVGSRCEMSLRVPDLKLSEMTATVISPSGKIAPCEIVPVDEDHYNIKFIPQEMGEHSVHVKYQGADIVGSPFQFTVGPIRDGMANKVRVLGSGIEEGVINEINAFTVYTREAGAGTLSIAIEGPSKAELDCEEQQDGSSYVTYRVGVPGLYTCSLKFNDEEIPFSPFRIYVMEPTDEDKIVSYDLPQTGTTFRGAEEAISSGGEEVASQIGHPIALTIHHKEVEGETLRATVQTPSGAIEEAIVHPIDEDQFAIRFIPHESGPHLFYVHSVPIEKADSPDIILGPSSPYRPIQGSPFRLFISQHAADPGMVTASGEGLRHGKVDMKNMFFVNTANAGSGVLNVTVDGPSKVSLTTQEQDEGYAFTYVPPVPGIYEITIKYGGNFHIAGSPFRAEITGVPRSSALESSKSEQQSRVLLETVGKTAIPRRLVGIRPENQADRVRCDGLGLKRADIRRINYFNVDASQAGSEILLVGIRGPTRPFEEVKIKHLGNNQYSVAYSVKESGRHLLMVKWGENHVPGSPFIVDVP